MRKLSLLIVFTLITCFSYAQSTQVSESKETMKEGTYNALVVDLPDADDKKAMKVWKSYIKAYGSKAKKVKKSKEVLSKDVVIADINNADPIQVFARAEDKSRGSELIVWFMMGEFQVSSTAFPTDYTAAQNFLDGYAHEVAKQLVIDELEDEQGRYKKLEKEMKKLQKKNDSYHKSIKKAKESIAKAEQNIEENERKQKEQTSLLEEQNKLLSEIKERLSEM